MDEYIDEKSKTIVKFLFNIIKLLLFSWFFLNMSEKQAIVIFLSKNIGILQGGPTPVTCTE